MKRFASLTTTTTLAGVLLGIGSTAFAVGNTYNMYLQPISPLGNSYAPGAIISFRAMVDILPNNHPTVLVLGPAIAYDLSVFDTSLINATADTSPYLPKPSQLLWNTHDTFYYGQTTTGPKGNPLATFVFGVGHASTWLEPAHTITTIPAGTYTISTFSFPVFATTPSGPTTLYLPTAFGFGGNSKATDSINANDASGSNNQVLAFPNDGISKFSSLTYNIGTAAVPEPSSLAFLLTAGLTGTVFMRRRRNR